jgi:hypothetical protein
MTNIILNIEAVKPLSSMYKLGETFIDLAITAEQVAERIKQYRENFIQYKIDKFIEENDKEEEIEINECFSFCGEKDTWEEMSYCQYNQGLLDFSYSEYSDGDWNLE